MLSGRLAGTLGVWIDRRKTACYFAGFHLILHLHMPINDDFVYAPPQDALQILYEDEDLVVIEKPAGLLSVPGRLPEHQDSAYLRILDSIHRQKLLTVWIWQRQVF